MKFDCLITKHMRTKRLETGLSQKQIASKSCLDTSTFRRWECGHMELETLNGVENVRYHIENGLGLKLDEFMRGVWVE